MNPIEPERLKIDSVAQIKNVVKTFYQTKQLQCQQLLESLDQMKHERRYVMGLKKKQFNDLRSSAAGNLHDSKGPYASHLPEKSNASEKVNDVRLNVQLNRIRKYKHVAAKSIWYSELLMQLISKKIERKPLVLYLNGKSQYTLTVIDSIRNVIESGEVFTENHLRLLEGTLDEIDITKPEVKEVLSLVRGYLAAD